MKLRWTRRARRDLIEIARYIERDKPEAARRWVDLVTTRGLAATSDEPAYGAGGLAS